MFISDEVFTTPNLMGVIGMEYKNRSVGTPIGEIISYMGTITPANYLICDGSLIFVLFVNVPLLLIVIQVFVTVSVSQSVGHKPPLFIFVLLEIKTLATAKSYSQ